MTSFEADEFERVVRHLPEYLQDAARFAYMTGWRKEEVVGLRWEMVDLDAQMITLPTGKNGRARTIACSGDLLLLLTRSEARRLVDGPRGPRVADYVFHRGGRPLGDFKKAWHSALVAAGLSHVAKLPGGRTRIVHNRLFHDLRRTAARNMLRSGVREGVAMSITGHRTRSMFDRYAIVASEDQRAAFEALRGGA